MNAQQLSSTLSFIGGRPMLILRDGTGGRIKIHIDGEWAMTIAPGSCLGLTHEAVLMTRFDWCKRTNNWEGELRGSWGLMALQLSHYQQNGGFLCDEQIEEMDPLGLLRWPA
jgi:hypothetical protein